MLVKEHGAYRQQDGQVLVSPGPGKDPHPVWRWGKRAPEELEDANVRAMWREGRSIDWSGDGYARLHEDSGMLLIASYGVLQTVVRAREVEDEPDDEIVRQYKEGLLDAE